MCIIVYKPKDVDMPKDGTLVNCFVGNPDGAGYMFTENNKVHIKKGFMDYKNFYDSLMNDYYNVGKSTPFVLHFRIGTQGGNIPANTHPFPISQTMSDLQQLDKVCDVAMAHNGILSITSTGYYSYKNKVTTSDTMDFITEYLSLIVTQSDWYKAKSFDKSKLLIERLIGHSNKFAIMSNDGHTELIGDFIYDKKDKCYYSNTSYEKSPYTYRSYDSIEEKKSNDDESEWDKWINDSSVKMDYQYFDKCRNEDGWYDFDESYCPFMTYDDDSYCYQCRHFAECMFGWEDVKTDGCVSGAGCECCRHKFECPNRLISEEEIEKNEKNKK